MRFAKWVFMLAGASGFLMVFPGYFLEAQTNAELPPPINHPEYYYGFIGVTVAWQLMFLVIASDPVRYRTAMLPALVEKASFSMAIPVLYALGRVPALWLAAASMDGTWLILFAVAFLRTPNVRNST